MGAPNSAPHSASVSQMQREQISTLLLTEEQKALQSGKTDYPGPKMHLAKKGIFMAANNECVKKCCRDPSKPTLPALSAYQKKKKTKMENIFEQVPLAPFCGMTAQLCARQLSPLGQAQPPR